MYSPPPDSYVAAAKVAVHRELAGTLGFPDAPEEQVRDAVRALAVGDDAAVTRAHRGFTCAGSSFLISHVVLGFPKIVSMWMRARRDTKPHWRSAGPQCA